MSDQPGRSQPVRQNKNALQLIRTRQAPKIHSEGEERSRTDSDYLWLLIFGHVDGGPGDSGKDDQGRVQEIHFDWDIMCWGAVLVAHVDLQRRRKSTSSDSTKAENPAHQWPSQ